MTRHSPIYVTSSLFPRHKPVTDISDSFSVYPSCPVCPHCTPAYRPLPHDPFHQCSVTSNLAKIGAQDTFIPVPSATGGSPSGNRLGLNDTAWLNDKRPSHQHSLTETAFLSYSITPAVKHQASPRKGIRSNFLSPITPNRARCQDTLSDTLSSLRRFLPFHY